MPLDDFQQSRCHKQSQNLDPEYDDANRPYQAVVLLDPAGNPPQTSAQEDHTLRGELIEQLGSHATLRVPHCAVLQRVHTAGCRNTAGQHSWS